MNAALVWILAHPAECAGAGLVALNVANALLPYDAMRGGSTLRRVVGWGLDRLAVLARRDSPATLVPPGVASPPPSVPPTPLTRAGDDRPTIPPPPREPR